MYAWFWPQIERLFLLVSEKLHTTKALCIYFLCFSTKKGSCFRPNIRIQCSLLSNKEEPCQLLSFAWYTIQVFTKSQKLSEHQDVSTLSQPNDQLFPPPPTSPPFPSPKVRSRTSAPRASRRRCSRDERPKPSAAGPDTCPPSRCVGRMQCSGPYSRSFCLFDRNFSGGVRIIPA